MTRPEPPRNDRPDTASVGATLRARWRLDEDAPGTVLSEDTGRYPGTRNVRGIGAAARGVRNGAISHGGIEGDEAAIPDLASGSLAFWARIDAANASGLLFFIGMTPRDRYPILGAALDREGRLTYQAGETAFTAPKPFAPGVFHHLAFTWSKTGRALFVDGEPAGSDGLAVDLSRASLLYFHAPGFGPTAPSTLDDIRVYESPLSSSDVRALWKEGAAVPGVAGVPRPQWVVFENDFEGDVPLQDNFCAGGKAETAVVDGESGKELRLRKAADVPRRCGAALELPSFHADLDPGAEVTFEYDLAILQEASATHEKFDGLALCLYAIGTDGRNSVACLRHMTISDPGLPKSGVVERFSQVPASRWQRGAKVDLNALLKEGGRPPAQMLTGVKLTGGGESFDYRIDNLRLVVR